MTQQAGSFAVRDGRTVRLDAAGGAEAVADTPELRALIDLRDAALALLALEADATLDDVAIAPTRARALGLYTAYVERFGPLNRGELRELRGGRPDPQTGEPDLVWRRPDLGGFRLDPDYHPVMALEVFDSATRAAEPAPILLRRVHGRPEPVRRAADAHEALLVCLGEGGDGVDPARVAELLGLRTAADAVEALGDLVFRDPDCDGRWVSRRDYLTGDVRAKRAVAERAARDDRRYRRNVAALAEVEPADLGPLEIFVSLGARWVAASDVEAFVHEVLGGRVKVWHLPSAASWKIVPLGKTPVGGFGLYSTPRMGAYDLLTAGLNGRAPVVFDTVHMTGRRLRLRNAEASLAAVERLTALQERFRTWLWEDAERTARLTREYNRRFNTHLVRRHDGSALTFPGLADGLELWPWQRDIVAQIVSSPATLCAHAVGAGKTRSMVCAALTARRLGLAAKPLITVPAHLVEQTAREARQAYPFGRFLVHGGTDGTDEPRHREQLAARCATGDWDAVIVSHGTFSALPVQADSEIAHLQDEVAVAQRQIAAGQGGRHGRSVLQRRVAALEARIEHLRVAPRPAITFDDLGVDLLLVDEAHYFKRLPIASRMAGISLGSSRRAADLHLKAQLLRRRRGRRPTLALFTGTPWSNTIAETFVWQTYLQPDALAAAGVEHFDAWAAVFVDYATTVEITPDASAVRLVQRAARIRNLPELRRMLAGCSDILRPEELGLERPERAEQTVVCAPGDGQLSYVRSLGARVDKIRREQVRSEPGGDNMLAVCGDGRRAALDPRLVGIDEPSAKLAAVADGVAEIHHEHAGHRFPGSDVPGVLQLVFCDQGTPGSDGPQSYGRLRILLAQRGVPADRVRWVHEARTPEARARLFAQCRDGAVSVLIGSTDKLGVGTNVQRRLRAVHHADAPWRPSDIEQREGRAFRPGNLNPVVEVRRYVTKATFDAYMWQALQRKAAFVEQLYRIDPGVRTVDDLGDAVLTYAEVKALATGNALLLDQAQAAADVARLRLLRSINRQELTGARARLEGAEQDQYRLYQQLTLLAEARERLRRAPEVSDPEADVRLAARALRERLLVADGSDDPAPVRAPWRGLGVELLPDGGWHAQAADVVSLRITVAHRRADEIPLPLSLLRGSAAACAKSVVTQLRRWVARLDERMLAVEQEALDAHRAGEDAKRLIDAHRFTRTDELAAAEARLAEIDTALEASVGHGATALA
ncbi:helicase-related protein [uncultured Jatrophihabitans sp.]|uniref:helicase-related protein n=1 Tax=uncultured Jatrophihabitans sp. TaxID=1610747 RepID=UPI0035CC9F32